MKAITGSGITPPYIVKPERTMCTYVSRPIRQIVKTSILTLFMAWLALPVFGQQNQRIKEQQEAAEKAYARAYELVLDEQWGAAQESLKSFLVNHQNMGGVQWRDDAEYWLCYVAEKSSDNLEVVFECYTVFQKKYHKSRWADDAKASSIRIAQMLVREGKPEYAAVVESMKKSDDEEVALSALYALQNIGDENAFKTIVGLYERSDSERLREKIVYIIGNFDSPEVVTLLSEIASSTASSRIRRNAVNALGNRDEVEAQDALKRVIENNGDTDVQKSALYALGNTESAEILAFLRSVALNAEKQEVGKAATHAISNSGVPGASAALQNILQNAKHAGVRKAALYALGNLDDSSSLPALVKVAKDNSNRELQKTAVYAISNKGNSFAELRDIFESVNSQEVKRATLHALANLDDHRVNSFLLEVALNDENIEIAKGAVYALSNPRRDWQESLKVVLKNSNRVEVKKAALYQLADDIDTLKSVLDNETDRELRKAAVHAMGNSNEKSIVPLLLDIAQNDVDVSIRKTAINALGNIGGAEAQKALIEILEQD